MVLKVAWGTPPCSIPLIDLLFHRFYESVFLCIIKGGFICLQYAAERVSWSISNGIALTFKSARVDFGILRP